MMLLKMKMYNCVPIIPFFLFVIVLLVLFFSSAQNVGSKQSKLEKKKRNFLYTHSNTLENKMRFSTKRFVSNFLFLVD